jgi:hypothetical protein
VNPSLDVWARLKKDRSEQLRAEGMCDGKLGVKLVTVSGMYYGCTTLSSSRFHVCDEFFYWHGYYTKARCAATPRSRGRP